MLIFLLLFYFFSVKEQTFKFNENKSIIIEARKSRIKLNKKMKIISELEPRLTGK